MVAAAGGPAVKITPCRWCSWTQIRAEESHGHQRHPCATQIHYSVGVQHLFSQTLPGLFVLVLVSMKQASSRGVIGGKTCKSKAERQKRAKGRAFRPQHLRKGDGGGDGVGGISDGSISLGSFTQANGDSCSFNVPSVQSLAVSHPGGLPSARSWGWIRLCWELPINYFSPKANDTGSVFSWVALSVPEIATFYLKHYTYF